MIILIDNYDSFTFNVFHYLSEIGAKIKVFRNDKISPEEILEMKPQGIVLSPGPKTPNEAGISLELIKKNHLYPMLGICLGHQAIAQAYGGKIIRAKIIMHGKLSNIYHDNSLMFKDIPQDFLATRYHSLIVEESSLPDNININATAKDKYIMSISIPTSKAYGVQFHPESYDTEVGYQLINNFINICEKK